MKYDVHVFATIRVKVSDVEAESQEEAIKKAEDSIDFYDLLLDVKGKDTEFAEEIGYYLVDEHGDRAEDKENDEENAYVNSRWRSGQFSIDRQGCQYPQKDKFETLLTAAKGVIEGWEHNLTEPINELAAAIEAVEEANHA
jgi:hypothetical protein